MIFGGGKAQMMVGLPGGSGAKEFAYNAGDTGQEDPPEKEMEAHSSVLAWEISSSGEPGALQSMGS